MKNDLDPDMEKISEKMQDISGFSWGVKDKKPMAKEVRFGLDGNKIVSFNISNSQGKLLIVCGKKGYGKTSVAEVFQCGFYQSGYKVFRIDIEGEAISNREPNLKDEKILSLYGNKPFGIPLKIYAPFNKKREMMDSDNKKMNDVDVWFKLPKYLTLSDYNLLLQVTPYMERKLKAFYEQIENEEGKVTIDSLINTVESLKKFQGREHFMTRLLFVKGLISDKEDDPDILDLEALGKNKEEMTVIDISVLEGEDLMMQSLVAFISQKIYNLRESGKIGKALIILDEAHRFIYNTSGTALRSEICTKNMLKVAKQGRKRDLSLILISQSISDIHDKIFSETDLYVILRMNLNTDMNFTSDSLGSISKEQRDKITQLPRFSALCVMENKSVICKLSPPNCQHKF